MRREGRRIFGTWRGPWRVTWLGVALCLGAAWLGGCQRSAGRPGWDREALRGETFTARSPSLVLGEAGQRTGYAGRRPWWYDRRDASLNVDGGPNRPEIVEYSVRTRDRQHSHDGRIHNSYDRSIRIRERGRVVR